MECPNDINGMIDAAKFADLALLLVDGSYGFEMVSSASSFHFAFNDSSLILLQFYELLHISSEFVVFRPFFFLMDSFHKPQIDKMVNYESKC